MAEKTEKQNATHRAMVHSADFVLQAQCKAV
jgi:hypothetical protein